MPVYEYECTNCHFHFERRQHISDAPIQVCPECAGEVRRVFHPVGIIFKGSGFYATDNRRGSMEHPALVRRTRTQRRATAKVKPAKLQKPRLQKVRGRNPSPKRSQGVGGRGRA